MDFHVCVLENIDGQEGPWYKGVPDILGNRKVELLIVDGPPREIFRMARYPALPMLYEYLSEACTVVLDDVSRNDEKEIIKRWLELYPEFKIEYIREGHGIAMLTRKKSMD